MTANLKITTRLVSSPLEFAALEDSWNRLYDLVDTVTLFSSWDWLYTWWEVYAECDLRDLFILCFSFLNNTNHKMYLQMRAILIITRRKRQLTTKTSMRRKKNKSMLVHVAAERMKKK